MEILSAVPWYGAKFQIAEALASKYKRSGITTFIDGCGGSGKMVINAPAYPEMVYNDLDTALCCMFRCIKEKNLFLPFLRELNNRKYELSTFEKANNCLIMFDIEQEMVKNSKLGKITFDLNNEAVILEIGISKYIVICQSYNATQSSFRPATVENLETYHNRFLTLVDVHYRMNHLGIEISNKDMFQMLEDSINEKDSSTLYALDVPYIAGDDQERKAIGAYHKMDWDIRLHERLMDIVYKEFTVPILICGYKSLLYKERLLYDGSPWKEIGIAEVAKSASSKKVQKQG